MCQVSVLLKYCRPLRLSFTWESPIIPGMQKFAAPFVGAAFCGDPCSAEHAAENMPKSAVVGVTAEVLRAKQIENRRFRFNAVTLTQNFR